jgi:nucleoid-associated protein YgaU
MVRWSLWCAAGLVVAVLSTVAGVETALAEEASSGSPAMIEHQIQKGDNLHLIAGYYYKDPRQWKRIFRVNRNVITNPNRISPGRTLKIEGDLERQWDISYAEFISRVYR